MKLSTAKASKAKSIDVSIALDAKLLPRVSVALNLSDLKEECKAREMKGYSTFKKDRLLELLRVGSICISQTREYKVLEEVKAIMKKEEMQDKGTNIKPSQQLPSQNVVIGAGSRISLNSTVPPKAKEKPAKSKPEQLADLPHVINTNYDIGDCFDLGGTTVWSGSYRPREMTESDEDDPPRKRIKTTTSKANKRSLEDQPKHSARIQKPNKEANQNPRQLLKFVVWSSAVGDYDEGEPEKEFDSSWNTIAEANQRANYVFFHANEWGFSKSEMKKLPYHETFDEKTGFVKYYVHPDDSDEYTVTVVEKEVFEYFLREQKEAESDYGSGGVVSKTKNCSRTKDQLEVSKHSAVIKKPNKANQNSNQLLKYVVWSSACYPRDRRHSYEGGPKKEFDSSWNTIAEANKRANYLFFDKNIWGLSRGEIEEQDYKETFDSKERFVKYYVHPDDSEVFTVAVVEKEVFEFFLRTQREAGSDDDSDDDSDSGHGRIWAF
eukprot:gene9203-9989_t